MIIPDRFAYSPLPPLSEGSSPVLSEFYKRFHNAMRVPENMLPAHMLSPMPAGMIVPANRIPKRPGLRVSYF